MCPKTNISELDAQLLSAVDKSDLNGVKKALDSGANVNAKDEYGTTVLNHASERGNLELITLLLEKNADINLKSEYGETALNEACRRGYLEIVKLLLEKGADIDNVGAADQTPLINAVCNEHITIIQLLLDKGAKVTSSALSTAQLRINVAEEGVENGMLLSHAPDIRRVIMNLLLEGQLKGLFPNISKLNFELVAVLLSNNIENAKTAIKNGADVNIATIEGSTVLLLASRTNCTEFAKLLLANKANPNIQNQYKDTALIHAAYNNNFELVKLLLANGADPKLVNEKGKTALNLTHNEEVKKLLTENKN